MEKMVKTLDIDSKRVYDIVNPRVRREVALKWVPRGGRFPRVFLLWRDEYLAIPFCVSVRNSAIVLPLNSPENLG